MTLVLGAAVAAAGGLALLTSHNARGTTVQPEVREPAAALAMAPAAAAEADDTTLSGAVLETLAASKYTYLRLATATGEVWAAVPSALVPLGTRVAIANATRMDNFKSATLKRTFPLIYFGTLAGAPAATAAQKFSPADVLDNDEQALPAGHPDIGAAAVPGSITPGSDTLPPGHPDLNNAVAQGGPQPMGAPQPELPSLPIPRARGARGHLISELSAMQALVGQLVRVRGQVTKVTPDVQGHTFFHLRDGSPDGKGKASDLVVTSSLTPERGQVATFEGTLRANVDIGIGYSYAILLENATLIEE